MATRFASRTATALLVGTLFASVLAGCGSNGMGVSATDRVAAAAEAQATNTLKKGFSRIHKAIFNQIDVDHNKYIDEYEAGSHLSLDDFRRADSRRNGRLTFSEFEAYATTNLFFFHDTPERFMKRFRSDLGSVFKRLDENRDGMLANSELSNADLKKIRLSFDYPRLNISVKLQEVSDDQFKAADKTGDNKLGQAEFEDLYLELAVAALGGDPAPAPGPQPAPSEVPAPQPAPSEVPAPVPSENPAPAPATTKVRR